MTNGISMFLTALIPSCGGAFWNGSNRVLFQTLFASFKSDGVKPGNVTFLAKMNLGFFTTKFAITRIVKQWYVS